MRGRKRIIVCDAVAGGSSSPSSAEDSPRSPESSRLPLLQFDFVEPSRACLAQRGGARTRAQTSNTGCNPAPHYPVPKYSTTLYMYVPGTLN